MIILNSTVNLHYIVKKKTQIRAGTVVPVYPQPNDEESFWLLRIRSVGDVNVYGRWLNKIKENDYATMYSLEEKDLFLLKT